jgi:hypothetical protein
MAGEKVQDPEAAASAAAAEQDHVLHFVSALIVHVLSCSQTVIMLFILC